jgi:hypothetical protein
MGDSGQRGHGVSAAGAASQVYPRMGTLAIGEHLQGEFGSELLTVLASQLGHDRIEEENGAGNAGFAHRKLGTAQR